jgi:hypothetical protein
VEESYSVWSRHLAEVGTPRPGASHLEWESVLMVYCFYRACGVMLYSTGYSRGSDQ